MRPVSRYSTIPPSERLPEWLRSPLGNASELEAVQAVVKQQRLHTICEEGRCPNRGECYASGTATFLLGGPVCTRSCAFCQVEKGQAPSPFDAGEAERVAEAVEAMGLRYVDAPISGGAAKAASGQMTMMTAGKPEAYALAEPFLNAMAAKVYKLGDSAGAGSKVKIINQLLAGVHIAAAAEAMALGLREGVDPAALYEVITHSAGNSWMFENRMAHVLAADYTPLSAVDIFVKDLGIVLDMARASKFPLPLSSTAHQMFMQASTAGFAKEDDSAVIKIFPGIELPKGKA